QRSAGFGEEQIPREAADDGTDHRRGHSFRVIGHTTPPFRNASSCVPRLTRVQSLVFAAEAYRRTNATPTRCTLLVHKDCDGYAVPRSVLRAGGRHGALALPRQRKSFANDGPV